MKRKPLSTDDIKALFGGTFGDPAPKSKLQAAIEQADEDDATRRRDNPTLDELVSALKSGELSDSDSKHIERVLRGNARPAGAPKNSANAQLGRDLLLYIEYCKQLGKGLDKTVAELRAARLSGEGVATVQAAKTKARKLFRPKK